MRRATDDGETVLLDDPRTLAALALGLAQSRQAHLDAVDELARSGDPEHLLDALTRLTDAGHTPVPVLTRARALIDEAVAQHAGLEVAG